MKKIFLISTLFISLTSLNVSADSKTVNKLLNRYTQQDAVNSDANAGKILWLTLFESNDGGPSRSCSSCHTKDLIRAGKHMKTGKIIEPMSPSINQERLSDYKTVEKWFKRNCKWTMGRECSPQEKSDFIGYINAPLQIKF